MDLLFKRYASPFLFINNLISTSRLTEFIDKLLDIKKTEDRYEFYIHKLPPWDERTFEQFCFDLDRDEGNKEEVTDESLETIINKSYRMVNSMK